ncbi:IS1096 element passenger TnpR family protein [Ornithobacterium rhinotracheale]|uniref:IS1096 element passenger TnpR family protein n=1 Tax=Ornithobacterium rhinotracheale TaxID=28251 RepID=UPI0040375289
MILKIRVILDAEQDVFRDIEIEEKSTLFEFHQAIKNAFGLAGEEMASFFLSNDQWFQGSEIPLENMAGDEDAETMQETTLSAVVPKKGGRMIYLYDFFSMWTFFCEVVDRIKKDSQKDYPLVSLIYGECPKEAPNKEQMEFDIDEDGLNFEDDLDDDFEDGYDDDDYFDSDPYGGYY